MVNSTKHQIYPANKFLNSINLNLSLLNKAEHEIHLPTKKLNANIFWHFSIWAISMLSWVRHGKNFTTSGPGMPVSGKWMQNLSVYIQLYFFFITGNNRPPETTNSYFSDMSQISIQVFC